MDVRFINPFIEAVFHVFKTMLGTEVVVGKPFLKARDEAEADVLAVIGLSGEVNGSVVLAMPQLTAGKTVAAFAQSELPADDPQFADALGELTNMIAGQAKSKFEGKRCSISLPRVFVGQAIRSNTSTHHAILILPCDSAFGRFRLEVSIARAAAGAPEPKADSVAA